MQRQDSLLDQLASVAADAEARGDLTVAAWLRGKAPPPSLDAYWRARKLAIALGCYDADDWLGNRKPPITGAAGG